MFFELPSTRQINIIMDTCGAESRKLILADRSAWLLWVIKKKGTSWWDESGRFTVVQKYDVSAGTLAGEWEIPMSTEVSHLLTLLCFLTRAQLPHSIKAHGKQHLYTIDASDSSLRVRFAMKRVASVCVMMSMLSCFALSQGQWYALGNGLFSPYVPAASRGIVRVEDYLYVGGLIMRAGTVPVSMVARWSLSRQQWDSLGGGVNSNVEALLPVVTPTRDTLLFVGGAFDQTGD